MFMPTTKCVGLIKISGFKQTTTLTFQVVYLYFSYYFLKFSRFVFINIYMIFLVSHAFYSF